MCYSPIFLLLVCRTHRVTHAWCTAACTGVLYVRSIGRWRDIYPVILPCPWPLLILLQFKRWMQVETRKLHRLLKMAPNTPPWRYSLCRICLLLYTELKTAFLSLFFLGVYFCFLDLKQNKVCETPGCLMVSKVLNSQVVDRNFISLPCNFSLTLVAAGAISYAFVHLLRLLFVCLSC